MTYLNVSLVSKRSEVVYFVCLFGRAICRRNSILFILLNLLMGSHNSTYYDSQISSAVTWENWILFMQYGRLRLFVFVSTFCWMKRMN